MILALSPIATWLEIEEPGPIHTSLPITTRPAIMAEAGTRQAKVIEASKQAEADWVTLVNEPDQMTDYLNSCTPGYYNSEGTVNGNDGFLQGHYAAGGVAFYAMLREWLAKGDMAGLELK